MSRFPAPAALHRKCQVADDDSTPASAPLGSIVLVWLAAAARGTPARQIEMLIWKTHPLVEEILPVLFVKIPAGAKSGTDFPKRTPLDHWRYLVNIVKAHSSYQTENLYI